MSSPQHVFRPPPVSAPTHVSAPGIEPLHVSTPAPIPSTPERLHQATCCLLRTYYPTPPTGLTLWTLSAATGDVLASVQLRGELLQAVLLALSSIGVEANYQLPVVGFSRYTVSCAGEVRSARGALQVKQYHARSDEEDAGSGAYDSADVLVSAVGDNGRSRKRKWDFTARVRSEADNGRASPWSGSAVVELYKGPQKIVKHLAEVVMEAFGVPQQGTWVHVNGDLSDARVVNLCAPGGFVALAAIDWAGGTDVSG